MNRSRCRKVVGTAVLGTVALMVSAGFGACAGPKGPLPPSLVPPEWSETTVDFFHQPTPLSGPTTGWVTTVNVPQCFDYGGASVVPVVSVSNGTITGGSGTYTWTRVVTGAPPVQRVPGTFTADCIDHQGLHAHPVLAVPSN